MNPPVSLRLVALALATLLATAQVGEPERQGKVRWEPDRYEVSVPRLASPPHIDGDLSEWKSVAFTDGLWDLTRVRHAPWFDPAINRLTDHGGEPSPECDLQARYYLGWDETYLYFGAEVRDNVNDTSDPGHQPRRWYFKDAVGFFIEAPADRTPERFGPGDNAFCFVIDPAKPPYGAWWRHGTPTASYVEEVIPPSAVRYEVRMDPWKRGRGDFVLEARVAMAPTLGRSDPVWRRPRPGDVYRLQIVHTDPDGGGYGGHILLYGQGDDDSTWARMILTDSLRPIERKAE
jgi:hypothetical protein